MSHNDSIEKEGANGNACASHDMIQDQVEDPSLALHNSFALLKDVCDSSHATETVNGDWEIRPLPQPITTNHISLTSDKLLVFIVLEPVKTGLKTAVTSSAAALNSVVILPKSWGDLADEESDHSLENDFTFHPMENSSIY